MVSLRSFFYFISAFILGLGVLLGAFHHAGLFQVASIPIEVVSDVNSGAKSGAKSGETLDHSKIKIAERDLAPGPAGLRSRLAKRLSPLKANHIWEIDIQNMRASILRDEWVKDVLISRTFPNSLRVKVTPKTPVLLLLSEKGALLPVTDDGSLLSALPFESAPDVPILRGAEFLSSRERRSGAVALALDLPAEGPLRRRNISEISWSKDFGYSLTLIYPRVDVNLGDDRLPNKILRVTQVMNYLSANQLQSRVIDASFSKKVLVRLRKGP